MTTYHLAPHDNYSEPAILPLIQFAIGEALLLYSCPRGLAKPSTFYPPVGEALLFSPKGGGGSDFFGWWVGGYLYRTSSKFFKFFKFYPQATIF